MAVWLAALAFALPVVILIAQRIRAPRDLVARQRIAHTLMTVFAVPVSWAAVSWFSGTLLALQRPAGDGTYALSLLVPSAILLGVVLAARSLAWTRAWPLLLAPLLSGVAVGGFALPALLIESPNALLLLVPIGALATAGIAGPAAAGALARATAPRIALVALSLLVLLVPAAYGVLAPLVGFTDGGMGSAATQSWELTFTPESEAPFVLVVPFLALADEPGSAATAEAVLARLRDSLHVAEGQATVALVEEGRAIEVRGRGPVRILAETAYYGPGNEAFLRYRVPGELDVALGEGSPPGRLALFIEFSGGSGHTCWASASVVLQLAPGEPATLTGSNEGFREDGRIQALCA